MQSILMLLGVGLISYVVYLISGVGVALIAGSGILLLMIVIYRWFSETNENLIKLHGIQCEMHRDTHYHVRNINKRVG